MQSLGRGIGLGFASRYTRQQGEAELPVTAVIANKVSPTSVELSFTQPAPPASPIGFRLFVRIDDGAFTEVLPYSLVQTDLTPGSYTWQIVAVYANGVSPPANSNTLELFINRSLDFSNKNHSTMIHGI